MPEADWATITVMVAIGGPLWRQIASQGTDIRALAGHVDALGVQLADVDRRLARLEGWIEGERAGRARLDQLTGSSEGDGPLLPRHRREQQRLPRPPAAPNP